MDGCSSDTLIKSLVAGLWRGIEQLDNRRLRCKYQSLDAKSGKGIMTNHSLGAPG